MSTPGQVKFKVAKKLGKAIPPGSSFAQVDWDKADEYLGGGHNPDDVVMADATQIAQKELDEARREGNDVKARKMVTAINAYDNARFAIRASWCPVCLNFLHNCQCEVDVEKVDTNFIDKLTSRMGPTHSQLRKAKRESRRS